MANWRKTKTPAVVIAHQARCPSLDHESAQCRCTPSWRGRRFNPIARKMEWQMTATKDHSEVLSWLSAAKKGAGLVHERLSGERTFESIGDEWLAGVKARRIGRRKGRGRPYSDTTVADYARDHRSLVREEFGPMVADEIGEVGADVGVRDLRPAA